MKKLHLIYLSLIAVSLVTHCATNSPSNPATNGTQPPVDNTIPPPTDITPARTIHAHVNEGVPDDETVVDLAVSITVAEPTYSILEGNDDNIFSIDSSTGVITVAKASEVTYDAETKANNIHMLKVRARNGSDSTKATEAPLRIVVRGEGGAFITKWTVAESTRTVTIPTEGDGYNFTVDWGDDMDDTTTYMGTKPTATHTYVAAGTYTVMITGDFPRIYINRTTPTIHQIQTVEQWGSIAWTSMEAAFYGVRGLTVPAVDAPDLTDVTILKGMFRGTEFSFNQDISHWDTSNIEDMSDMFQGADKFNQPIGDWDTGMVENMSDMFSSARVFNQDIGAWNTARVTDMNGMFNGARAFNQPIGAWITTRVENMSDMFGDAFKFNQDIGSWDTAMVTDMDRMFKSALAFNQDIGTDGDSWNTGRVIHMGDMFNGASAFNQDIGNWDTARVTKMKNMFNGATIFNQNISNWNVCAVTVTMREGFTNNSALVPSNRPDFADTAGKCP